MFGLSLYRQNKRVIEVLCFLTSALNRAMCDWDPISDEHNATPAHSQTALLCRTEWVSESRCESSAGTVYECVLVSHPSSVSLMMSQISMLSVQSSFCSEPSVAFSVRNQTKLRSVTDTNKHMQDKTFHPGGSTHSVTNSIPATWPSLELKCLFWCFNIYNA